MSAPLHLPCNVFVELVTDYLEGALDDHERTRVEAHLAICPPCQEVLAQWRSVVDLAGRLKPDDVDALTEPVRTSLMEAFREARSGPAA